MEANGHPKAPIVPAEAGKVDSLRSFPGPPANGKQTQTTLYNRAQLISSGILPPLEILINRSFNSLAGNADNGGFLRGHDRLRTPGQLLEELGHHPDTFVYIIATTDGELIGTAYASRYEGVEKWPEGPGERTWERLGVVGKGSEAWELHMMAVHPGYQRQGLANYLMDLVDDEVAARSLAAGGEGKKLLLYISTIKETNEQFYLRRGFKENYAVRWPVGHLGSENGFTVCHMDREIKTKESQGP